MIVKNNRIRNYINTSESYSEFIYFSEEDKLVLIPIINLEIVHDFSDFKEGEKINFSYILLTSVKNIEWSFTHEGKSKFGCLLLNDAKSDTNSCFIDYFSVGGLVKTPGCEIKCYYNEFTLLLPDNYSRSNYNWVPKKTPFLKKNISMSEAEKFVKLKNIPKSFSKNFLQNAHALSKIDFFKTVNEVNKIKLIDNNW